MTARFWPLERGHIITSGFGPRWGTTHWGTDFGWNGGSGNQPVYAAQAGTVTHAGAASGFGMWVVVDHPTEAGSGTTVYGHVIPEVAVGDVVGAGQRIARVNPVKGEGNGHVDPHLHFEVHRWVWAPPGSDRLDPLPWLDDAAYVGDEPDPVPSAAGMTAETLARAMGGSVSLERYAALLPAFTAAMREAGCTTVERAAMWCAQLGHESGGLQWMEELASGAAYEGRRDLGNVRPGDGQRFKGRGPIQVTGRHNYTALSTWAHSRGLTPSPTFFVDQPAQLASDRYGFLGAVWYWTAARQQLNALADARDINGATRAINGGTNGLDDRTTRYKRCLELGAALLPEEGFMSALSAEEQRELYEAICKPKKSLVEGSQAEFDHETFGRLTDAAAYRTERAVAALTDAVARIEKKLEGGK